MSIKIVKQFTKKSESVQKQESVIEHLRARRAARKAAEALVIAKQKSKKSEDGEGEPEQVDDIPLDADTATVMFTDKDANVQVIVGEDPVDGGITVAVATAEHDNLEEEEVLASVTVGEGEEVPPAADPENPENPGTEETEEAKKAAAVKEARLAIKARLQR